MHTPLSFGQAAVRGPRRGHCVRRLRWRRGADAGAGCSPVGRRTSISRARSTSSGRAATERWWWRPTDACGCSRARARSRRSRRRTTATPASRRTSRCRAPATAVAASAPTPCTRSASASRGAWSRSMPEGRVRPFATITAPGLIDGIAFDDTGRFGYRLLVVTTHGKRATVDAIDCHGAVAPITKTAHRVEGGMVVAPTTFGRFAGDLIAPDELGGGVWAVTPGGRNLLVASSGLPHGPDTGVESEAFLPRRALQRAARRPPDAGEPASRRQRAAAGELSRAVGRRRAARRSAGGDRGRGEDRRDQLRAKPRARSVTSRTGRRSPTPRGTSRSCASYRVPNPTRCSSWSTSTYSTRVRSSATVPSSATQLVPAHRPERLAKPGERVGLYPRGQDLSTVESDADLLWLFVWHVSEGPVPAGRSR